MAYGAALRNIPKPLPNTLKQMQPFEKLLISQRGNRRQIRCFRRLVDSPMDFSPGRCIFQTQDVQQHLIAVRFRQSVDGKFNLLQDTHVTNVLHFRKICHNCFYRMGQTRPTNILVGRIPTRTRRDVARNVSTFGTRIATPDTLDSGAVRRLPVKCFRLPMICHGICLSFSGRKHLNNPHLF